MANCGPYRLRAVLIRRVKIVLKELARSVVPLFLISFQGSLRDFFIRHQPDRHLSTSSVIVAPSKVSSRSRWSRLIPISSTYDVGRVTLQVFEPLEAAPPADLILIFAIRRSIFSPRSYNNIFGTNK
jgi:hypothetical protein